MTLLTDVHLTFRTQSGWIDNGLSNRLDAFRAAGDCNMLRPRAMAPLAVDATGQFLWKQIFTTVVISSLGQLRGGVVAKQAPVVDLAREVVMLLPVVSRAHSPALFLGIPRHRKLRQNSSGGKIQVTARMISGADDVVDFLLEQVHFPVLLKQVALLEKPSVTANHSIVPVRRGVKVAIVPLIVFNDL